MSAFGVLFAILFVPESLARDKRRKFQLVRANPVGAFLHLKKMPFLLGMMVAASLVTMAGEAFENVWSYFTVEKFSWSEEKIGYSLGPAGVLFALVQGIVCPWLLPRLGDKKSIPHLTVRANCREASRH